MPTRTVQGTMQIGPVAFERIDEGMDATPPSTVQVTVQFSPAISEQFRQVIADLDRAASRAVEMRAAYARQRTADAAFAAFAAFGCGCPICRAMREQYAQMSGPMGYMAARGAFTKEVSDAEARTSLERDILAHATASEIQAVRRELHAGRLVNTTRDCVIAIIADERGLIYRQIAMRATEFEFWLNQLPLGATPATNEIAATLDGWLAAWLERVPSPTEDAAVVIDLPNPDLLLDLPPRRPGLAVDVRPRAREAVTADLIE